jgi:hypothetical protein
MIYGSHVLNFMAKSWAANRPPCGGASPIYSWIVMPHPRLSLLNQHHHKELDLQSKPLTLIEFTYTKELTQKSKVMQQETYLDNISLMMMGEARAREHLGLI